MKDDDVGGLIRHYIEHSSELKRASETIRLQPSPSPRHRPTTQSLGAVFVGVFALVAIVGALSFRAIGNRSSDALQAGAGVESPGSGSQPLFSAGHCDDSVTRADYGPERSGPDANPPTAALRLLDDALAAGSTSVGGYWASSSDGQYLLNVAVVGSSDASLSSLQAALTEAVGSSRWEVRYVPMMYSKRAYVDLQANVQRELEALPTAPADQRPMVLPEPWTTGWVIVWVSDAQGAAADLVRNRYSGTKVCWVDASDAARGWVKPPVTPSTTQARLGEH